jgi:hypothetical protein
LQKRLLAQRRLRNGEQSRKLKRGTRSSLERAIKGVRRAGIGRSSLRRVSL